MGSAFECPVALTVVVDTSKRTRQEGDCSLGTIVSTPHA